MAAGGGHEVPSWVRALSPPTKVSVTAVVASTSTGAVKGSVSSTTRSAGAAAHGEAAEVGAVGQVGPGTELRLRILAARPSDAGEHDADRLLALGMGRDAQPHGTDRA